MEIGITIPLQKFLKWQQPPYGDEPRPFLCWDIHRADVCGRKLLVVVNAANRFAGVRTMTGSDWKKLDSIVPDVIAQAMETDGIPDWVQQRYFDAAGVPVFTKTHGRKPVAGLNRVVEDIWHRMPHGLHPDTAFQPDLTAFANGLLSHCTTRKDYVEPRKAFGEDLEQFIGEVGFERYLEGQGLADVPKAARIIPFPGAE